MVAKQVHTWWDLDPYDFAKIASGLAFLVLNMLRSYTKTFTMPKTKPKRLEILSAKVLQNPKNMT